jgi:hypothetical protein
MGTFRICIIDDPSNYPDGVDEPVFSISMGAGETVTWDNTTHHDCTITFQGDSPFSWMSREVPARSSSGPHGVRPGYPLSASVHQRPTRMRKLHKYSINMGGTIFDPGGGVRP